MVDASDAVEDAIYDMVPAEIMFLFLEQMSLETMGKMISTDKAMYKNYLEAFRKRWANHLGSLCNAIF